MDKGGINAGPSLRTYVGSFPRLCSLLPSCVANPTKSSLFRPWGDRSISEIWRFSVLSFLGVMVILRALSYLVKVSRRAVVENA